MASFALILRLLLACTFVQYGTARVTNPQRETSPNDRQSVFNRIRGLLRLQARQELCVDDDIFQAVQNYSMGNKFCSLYLGLPAATAVVDYTPTVTDTSTYTTSTRTTTELVRSDPVVTVTVSTTAGSAKVKRDANFADALHFIRQAVANSTTTADTPSFSQQISSACSCLPATALSTSTVTYTADPTHITQRAHVNVIQTVNSTAQGRATTTTVTTVIVVSGSTASSATSASSAAPTPISPPFTCPDDDNTVFSQIIEDQRYDFNVTCGFDVVSDNLASYKYSTLGECAAACARADNYFHVAVCQAAVFYPGVNSGAVNCFLKSSANSTVAMSGANAAILQKIAVAVTNSTGASSSDSAFTAASSTESADTSSMMSSIFANSSTSMPLITPAPTVSGRMPNNGETSYVTLVSDGSTYSSQTVYSTYYSSNNNWYISYYTSWTVAWSADTTVVGSSPAVSTSISSSDEGGSGSSGSVYISDNSSSGGAGGPNDEFSSTLVYSSEYSYTSTYGASGASGIAGSGGSGVLSTGASGAIAPAPTSNYSGYVYTSVYSTDKVVYSTVIVSSGGTAGASGYIISGGSRGSGTAISGAITPSTNTSSPSFTGLSRTGTEVEFSTKYSTAYSTSNSSYYTVIASSYGSAGGSGYVASGALGGSGTVISGAVTPTANETSPSFTGAPRSGTESVFSTVYSTAIVSSGGSGFVASGYGGGTGTALSGAATPSENITSPSTFSGTGLPRSGTEGPSTSSSIPEYSFSNGVYVSLTSSSPSFTGAPRSGTEGLASSGTPVPSSNYSTIPGPTGTSPISLNTTVPIVTALSGHVPSFTGNPRSGISSESFTRSGKFSTIPGPTGTVPVSRNTTIPIGTALSGYVPSFTDYPRSGTASVLPTPSSNSSVLLGPTSPSTSSFLPSYTGGFRSGSVSNSPLPTFNISSGAYSVPLMTGTSSLSIIGTGLSGFLVPTTNGSMIGPTGTSLLSSGSGLRSGTYSTFTPTPTGTNITSSSTCDMITAGTITMWSTVTEFGCYSTCTPSSYAFGGYNNYGGPPIGGPHGHRA